MSKQNQIGYGIIEPDIYEELNWNMDKIVSCLDLICMDLPDVLTDFPKSTKYIVLALGNPFGKPYPAIGFYSDNPKELDAVSDDYDFEEIIENWLTKDKIDDYKRKIANHKTISWNDLKNKNQ